MRRTRPHRSVPLLAALGVAAAAAPAAAQPVPVDLPAAEARALLERYQPAMRFPAHPVPRTPGGLDPRVEPFRPMAPADFVAMSRLQRRILGRWVTVRTPPAAGLAALPARPRFCAVRVTRGTVCWRLDVPGLSTDPGHRVERAYGARLAAVRRPGGAGRFAIVARAVTGGSADPGHRGWIALQYLSLYAFNGWAKPPGRGPVHQSHEGDWENAVVLLDAARAPQAVAYSQHGSGVIRPWAEVELTPDGHPVQYVARGSHAGHHQPGRFPVSTGYPQVDRIVDPYDWTETVPDGAPCPGPDLPRWGVGEGAVRPPCSAVFPLVLPGPGDPALAPVGWGGGGTAGIGARTVRREASPGPLAARREWRNPLADALAMNWGPSAALTVSPAAPVAGEPVVLTDASTDRDGRIVAWRWDLDADGSHDDAGGPTATVTLAAGTHTVGLEVRDDRYGTTRVRVNVVVGVPAYAPPG